MYNVFVCFYDKIVICDFINRLNDIEGNEQENQIKITYYLRTLLIFNNLSLLINEKKIQDVTKLMKYPINDALILYQKICS